MTVNYAIKNKVSEREFEQIVYRWLIEGDYTPDDITENIITENNILLIPLHYYTHEYSGACTATLGTEKLEAFPMWDFANQKYVQRFRSVIEWHPQPHSQPVSGTINTMLCAGGYRNGELTVFAEGMGWDASELLPVPPGIEYQEKLSSWFKLSKDEAWGSLGLKRAENNVYWKAKGELPCKHFTNLTVKCDYHEKNGFSVVAPYWLFTYQYKKESYFVIVDGNNPSRVAGKKPEDQERINTLKSLEWLGWLAGLSSIVSILYFSSGSFSDIDLTWVNAAIVASGLFLTWAIVELAVKFVKYRSKKTRAELFNRMFNRSELATQ